MQIFTCLEEDEIPDTACHWRSGQTSDSLTGLLVSRYLIRDQEAPTDPPFGLFDFPFPDVAIPVPNTVFLVLSMVLLILNAVLPILNVVLSILNAVLPILNVVFGDFNPRTCREIVVPPRPRLPRWVLFSTRGSPPCCNRGQATLTIVNAGPL